MNDAKRIHEALSHQAMKTVRDLDPPRLASEDPPPPAPSERVPWWKRVWSQMGRRR